MLFAILASRATFLITIKNGKLTILTRTLHFPDYSFKITRLVYILGLERSGEHQLYTLDQLYFFNRTIDVWIISFGKIFNSIHSDASTCFISIRGFSTAGLIMFSFISFL